MPEPGFTFALIDDAGEVRAVAAQTSAWADSFARHHRIGYGHAATHIIQTVFLGKGRLENGCVKEAFETVAIDRDGVEKVVRRHDTLEEATRFHAELTGC
jgi:hypothetical protein